MRRLIEQDQVLLLFNTFGTPPNSAIQHNVNDAKVPHLFIATSADRWNDPAHYPWTIGWPPSGRIEARIWARYILKSIPDAKIAVLYQNDDFGMDYITGPREGLGDKADKMIVATQSYETSDAIEQLCCCVQLISSPHNDHSCITPLSQSLANVAFRTANADVGAR